jgi:hypothetical protein
MRIDELAYNEDIFKFSSKIEEINTSSGIGYIDSILEYCKDTGLELEVAVTLISQNLKSKIEEEAMGKNLLKNKGARLEL